MPNRHLPELREKGARATSATWSRMLPKPLHSVTDFGGAAPHRKRPSIDIWRGVPQSRQFHHGFHLEDAIQDSRWILDLGENFDDEGSPGYSEVTWKRGIDFLLRNFEAAYRSFEYILPIPAINPAGSGSIDLYWRSESGELLINVPANLSARATFFGRTATGDTIGGELDPTGTHLELGVWLNQNL